MHGISAIIAVVLILLITISLAAGAYLFLSATMSQTTAAAQQGISQTMTQMTKSFAIEAVSGGKIWVRNTGQVPISNLTIYIDGAPANASNVVIQPGDVGVIQIYDVVDTSRPREIEIPGGTTTASKVVSGESLRDPTLVGYWKFDEGSGTTAADSSGNGNSGILVNGPAWVDGKYGKALNFSGTNQYVTFGNSSIFLAQRITVEVWVNRTGNKPWAQIVSTYNTYPNFGGWMIQTNDTGDGVKFGAVNYGDGLGWTDPSKAPIEQNKWYFLVGTFNGTDLSFYLNGALVSSTPLSAIQYAPTNTTIAGSLYYFAGVVDDVRIWSRALTPEEIWNHYVHGPI